MQGKRTNITIVFLEKILKFGLSSLIFSIALALGLILLNYIIAIKTPYIDVTRNKTNTLSMESSTLLDDINFNVNIKAFYTVTTQRRIGQLLDKYVKKNNRLKVEFIDPLKNPLVARDYDVTTPRTIVFETAGKESRINTPPPGQRHQERDITIALYRLLTEQTKTAYFTTGHGEFRITNVKQDGISIIKEELIKQNYLVETVNPLEEGQVPEDCSLLIIAGMTVPFTDEEAEMIRDYLDNGGCILAMIPPGIDTNLDVILGYYGIKFGEDYIYETSSKLTTDTYGPISPLCSALDDSEITGNLPNQDFLFPYVRSLNTNYKRGKIEIIKLIATSENSWAETDMESARKVNTNIKPSRDENETKGPITVAVVTEREFALPDSLIKREITSFKIRSGFFGNAAFITNSFVTSFPSNINLFLNTVNWITRNEKIIEITPHLSKFTPVELRQSQRRLLSWLTLVIFPSSILIVGIFVWYRRR